MDVPTHRDKGGVGRRNRLHQCAPHRALAALPVCRVGEGVVAVYDEAKWGSGLHLQFHWLRLRNDSEESQTTIRTEKILGQ